MATPQQGAFVLGATAGSALALEGAGFVGGVVLPAWRQLQALKAPLRAHPVPFGQPNPVFTTWPKEAAVDWRGWLAHGGYWPWHAWVQAFWPDPRFGLGALAVGLAVGGFLWWQVRKQTGGRSTWGGPPAIGKGQHGTAHWRPVADLARTVYRWRPPGTDRNGKPRKRPPARTPDGRPAPQWGVVIGQAGPGAAWVSHWEEHILLAGTTGSGKTRRVYLPTVGVVGAERQASLILTDMKGELYRHTAAYLEAQGYEIIRVDFAHPAKSGERGRWNPLAPVTEALARGDDPQAAEVAWSVAQALAVADYGGQARGDDAMWAGAGAALIAATALAVCQGEPPPGWEARLDAWVAEQRRQAATTRGKTPLPDILWTWPAPAARHLATVYQAIDAQALPLLQAWLAALGPGHPAAAAWKGVLNAAPSERTLGSVFFSASNALRLLADPALAWLLGAEGHPFDAAGHQPTAIYLVVPDTDSTRYSLVSLYLQRTIKALADLADRNQGGRLPTPVLFLLDEFGNFPPIADFDHIITMGRSRGMRFLVALQSFAQLDKAYGEQAGRIIRENLTGWLYLLTASPSMAREISDRLGQYTVATEGSTTPKVSGWLNVTLPGHASQSASMTSRPLLTPDEVMRLPPGRALWLQQREAPARLTLPDLSAWRAVFPALQQQAPEPEPAPMAPVPTWHLPVPGAAADTSGLEATGRRAAASPQPEESLERVLGPEMETGEGGVGMTDLLPADPALVTLFGGQAAPVDPDDAPPPAAT